MKIKREVYFDEEKGDNNIDDGDNKTLISNDVKIEIDNSEEDSDSNSKLQLYKSNIIILPFTLYICLCLYTPLSISNVYTLFGSEAKKYVTV